MTTFFVCGVVVSAVAGWIAGASWATTRLNAAVAKLENKAEALQQTLDTISSRDGQDEQKGK